MIDPLRITQRWLLGTAAVTSLLGTNPAGSIYGGADLPEKFDPALGPAVQFFGSGGSANSEIRAEVMPRITVKCWANVNEYQLARQVFRAVYDTLHGACMVDFGSDGRVLSCQSAAQPSEITDPDDGWCCVMGIFVMDVVETVGLSITDFVSSTQTVQQYIDGQLATFEANEDFWGTF